jgi:hypothetical protein
MVHEDDVGAGGASCDRRSHKSLAGQDQLPGVSLGCLADSPMTAI